MSDEQQIPEMSPNDLAHRLERGDALVLVDVREAFEREIADLPDEGQLRIPVAEFPARAHEVPKEGEVVLYCRSGSRSGWATRFLIEEGWENVSNLAGGVLGWRAEVDPTLEEY
ncbi:MAG: rhodanese-like domain-containing protein [Longimicrobiales bacterium]|nr:rhodanese-like domain-containing protein [Longimicrobiales bacterium]